MTYQAGLYEINAPAALTVYVEVEFHDTKTGSDWIRTNTSKIGEAICKGMCAYFGITYNQNSTGGSSDGFKSYIVRIVPSDGVNIRKGAGTDFEIAGAIAQGGAYTIVGEKSGKGASKWGKLKSGAGWIALDYTEKIK